MEKLTPRRPVDQAADALREAVLGGRYAPGDRLPPERQLAETLGISRLTLRAALSRLSAEGLVAARQGSGVTVLDWRTTGGVSLIPALVAHGHVGLLGPFLTLRRAVAAEAVAVACVRATDAELRDLADVADALSRQTDPDALLAGNLSFSRRILELADNVPMLLLFNTVARVFEAREELRAALLSNADAVRASFPLVVDLLARRDPDAARNAVRTALEALDAASLAAVEESP